VQEEKSVVQEEKDVGVFDGCFASWLGLGPYGPLSARLVLHITMLFFQCQIFIAS